ncbi:MAG: arabinose ABC transporter substrate-binding protein [Armatimonadota bacterium]|nr:arabinose ABC transporter substrate-binding protein [Armatimonadota bacterium]
MKKIWIGLAACAAVIAGCGETPGNDTAGGDRPKIGFLVKSATEVWFQQEWKFADDAAKDLGFDLIKIPTQDGEQVMSALDNLAAQGAQGVIICSPDVKLGPAIVAKCKSANLKLMSVDDRLVDADDKPLTDVPHLGISAHEIGKMVGQAIVDEMKVRGWDISAVGAIAVNLDELETARQRINGASEVLVAAGFDAGRIFKSPWKTQDIPGALDAASITLTQHGDIKKWVAFSSNDDGVLGVVRATEGRRIPASDVIGVGINGTSGVDDFKKESPTGFFGSVLLSPRKHGYDTCRMMYEWVKNGTAPPQETWTSGILITRENYEEKMKEEGLL